MDVQRITKEIILNNPELNETLLNFNEDNRCACFVAVKDTVVLAYAVVKYLNWDSDILKKHVATISEIKFMSKPTQEKQRSILENLLTTISNWAKSDKIDILSVKTTLGNNIKIDAFKKNNFFQMEDFVTYKHLLNQDFSTLVSDDVIDYKSEDLDAVGQIAYDSFIYSRYFKDDLIDQDLAKETRRQWILNDCKGRADKVFIALDNKSVAGFVACIKKSDDQKRTFAVLDLIAVSSKSGGKGLGTKLVNSFLNYAKTQLNAEYALVGTQKENIASCRLYEKCGFNLFKESLTFHKHFI